MIINLYFRCHSYIR